MKSSPEQTQKSTSLNNIFIVVDTTWSYLLQRSVSDEVWEFAGMKIWKPFSLEEEKDVGEGSWGEEGEETPFWEFSYSEH